MNKWMDVCMYGCSVDSITKVSTQSHHSPPIHTLSYHSNPSNSLSPLPLSFAFIPQTHSILSCIIHISISSSLLSIASYPSHSICYLLSDSRMGTLWKRKEERKECRRYELINEWMDGWMDRWMDRMNGWMNECKNDGWMNDWMEWWMNEWINEWMDVCMNGWMYGWIKELVHSITKVSFQSHHSPRVHILSYHSNSFLTLPTSSLMPFIPQSHLILSCIIHIPISFLPLFCQSLLIHLIQSASQPARWGHHLYDSMIV